MLIAGEASPTLSPLDSAWGHPFKAINKFYFWLGVTTLRCKAYYLVFGLVHTCIAEISRLIRPLTKVMGYMIACRFSSNNEQASTNNELHLRCQLFPLFSSTLLGEDKRVVINQQPPTIPKGYACRIRRVIKRTGKRAAK